MADLDNLLFKNYVTLPKTPFSKYENMNNITFAYAYILAWNISLSENNKIMCMCYYMLLCDLICLCICESVSACSYSFYK